MVSEPAVDAGVSCYGLGFLGPRNLKRGFTYRIVRQPPRPQRVIEAQAHDVAAYPANAFEQRRDQWVAVYVAR